MSFSRGTCALAFGLILIGAMSLPSSVKAEDFLPLPEFEPVGGASSVGSARRSTASRERFEDKSSSSARRRDVFEIEIAPPPPMSADDDDEFLQPGVPAHPSRSVQAPGYKMQNLTVRPTLAAAVLYDSNIFLSEMGKEEDVIVTVTPGIAGLWRMRDLTVSFDFDTMFARYEESDDDDFEDVRGGVAVERKLTPRSVWTAEVKADRINQRRGIRDADLPTNQAEPLVVKTFSAENGIKIKRKYFDVGAQMFYYNTDYDDVRLVNGAKSDQDFRDQDEFGASTTLNVKFSRYLEMRHDLQASTIEVRGNDFTADRDRNEYFYDAALLVRPDSHLLLNFNVGWEKEIFHDPAFQDTDWLPTVGIGAQWKPTRLLTVDLGWNRTETGVNFEENLSSSIRNSFEGGVVYKPARAWTVGSSFDFVDTEAVGGDFSVLTLDSFVEYHATRYTSLRIQHQYSERDSDRVNDSYEDDIVQFSIVTAH